GDRVHYRGAGVDWGRVDGDERVAFGSKAGAIPPCADSAAGAGRWVCGGGIVAPTCRGAAGAGGDVDRLLRDSRTSLGDCDVVPTRQVRRGGHCDGELDWDAGRLCRALLD